MTSVRVAAWQCVPLPRDVAGNLARLATTAAAAAAQGAEVLVVPESFTTGYAVGAATVAALAEPADGPTAAEVARIAAAHRIAIVYGFPERDGTAVFNSAALVDATGVRVGVHRKTHLWGEVDREQFSPGTAPGSYPWRATRVGLLICYDAEFPETGRRLAADQVSAVFVPTANPVGFDVVQDVLVRARAVENGFGVVYANYCGSDGALTYNGRSCIVGPDGAVLASADAETETLLIADLPSGTRPADHYRDRRPELYR